MSFDVQDVVSYLKSKKVEYDIYYDESSVLRTSIEKNKIVFASDGDSKLLGIRVVADRKLGTSLTKDVDNFKSCVDNAIKIAKLNNKDKYFKSFVASQKYKNIKAYDKKILDLSDEEIKDFMNEYISRITTDKRIIFESGGYTRGSANTRIINSEGVDAEFLSASNSMSAMLTMGDKNSFEGADDSRSLLKLEKADEFVTRLKESVEKQEVNTGDGMLLLHPEAAAQLLSSLIGFSFSGENIGLKKSRLYNSLGKQEFSKNISVTDDASVANLLGTRKCDDEGFSSKKMNLISKGLVKGFLYDNYNAKRFGVKNTGHASRNGVNPSIYHSNLIVATGKNTDKRLISSIDYGLYAKGLMALHTVDSVSGNFSLGVAEGSIIKNGEVGKAVKDTMIAGNLFELFKDIELSNKAVHGGSAIYTPHMLSKKIKIIGN